MTLVGRVHGRLVFPRRVAALKHHLAELLPSGAEVLDLGCGDGTLGQAVQSARPDVRLGGADVLVREETLIPVDRIESGKRLPYADSTFDAVLIVDVLHHADDPEPVLREAARVSRGLLIVKDHLSDPWLAAARLRFMDFVGNAHHRVDLPYNYWTRERWHAAFRAVGLAVEVWKEDLGLYPRPVRWLVEDGLHFIARLRRI